MVTESMLCIKNGKELFGQAQVCNVIVWLVIQMLVSVCCVYGVVLYDKYIQVGKQTSVSHISRNVIYCKGYFIFQPKKEPSVLNSPNKED